MIPWLCRLLGHNTYVCEEPTCYDYGHVVCRRCGRWQDERQTCHGDGEQHCCCDQDEDCTGSCEF